MASAVCWNSLVADFTAASRAAGPQQVLEAVAPPPMNCRTPGRSAAELRPRHHRHRVRDGILERFAATMKGYVASSASSCWATWVATAAGEDSSCPT